jgi:cell division protein FtsQ
MRQVRERKSQTRKVPARKAGTGKPAATSSRGNKVSRRTGAVAPGRRRAKTEKSFGRRGQRPPSRISLILDGIRQGHLPKLLVAASSAMLVSAAVVYGLAVGGHFAAAGAFVASKVDATIAGIGFRLAEVTVEGRQRTTRADVLAALNVEQGQSIFDVDIARAQENLLRLDWIAGVTVTRILPDRVHVELVERRPYAVWQRGGQLAVIDEEGRAITETGVDAYGHLPFFVGHGAARAASDFTKLVSQWPELQARIRAYVRVGDRRWNLRLENGVDVLLPETGLEVALADLVTIDETHRLMARDIEAIDMRLKDRFTVRLSPDAAARRNAVTQEWERRALGDDT